MKHLKKDEIEIRKIASESEKTNSEINDKLSKENTSLNLQVDKLQFRLDEITKTSEERLQKINNLAKDKTSTQSELDKLNGEFKAWKEIHAKKPARKTTTKNQSKKES